MLSMTYPQLLRNEVTYCGEALVFPRHQALFLSLLLLRPNEVIPYSDFIEYIWPDPDLEPMYVLNMIRLYKIRILRRLPLLSIHTFIRRGYFYNRR